MQKIFLYNEANGEFTINQDEIKLIKEFADLWVVAKEKCKCARDENGILTGNTESILKYSNYCKFVYLYADYASPYRDFTHEEKRNQCGLDAMLDGKEIDMPELWAACDKWSLIQEQDRNIRLLHAAQSKIDEMTDQLNQKKDPNTRYSIKDINDIVKALDQIGDASDMLDRFEERVRLGELSQSKVRSDATDGIIIDFEKEKKIREGKLNALNMVPKPKRKKKSVEEEYEPVDEMKTGKPELEVRKSIKNKPDEEKKLQKPGAVS